MGTNTKKTAFDRLFGRSCPVTLTYAGEPVQLKQPQSSEEKCADGCLCVRERYLVGGALQVSADIRYYDDFPASYWTLRLKNVSDTPTELISNVKSLDFVWQPPLDTVRYPEFPLLRYSRGSEGRGDDFLLCEEVLNWGQKKEFCAINGVCSDVHLPFFNLKYGAQGILLAVGWTGNWTCSFDHTDYHSRHTFHLEAGIEDVNFYLEPGEEVLLPSILLLHWEGEMDESHNLLRRLLVRDFTPRRRPGEELRLPVSCTSWGGLKAPGHAENIAFIREKKLPFTCYWMDAGWFGPPHDAEEYQNLSTEDWYGLVGDWRVNSLMHPQGLRPVSDAAHAAGMDFLLWIEPERAVAGTPVTLEHPEWCLHLPPEMERPPAGKYESVDALFFDYSNPDALAWMTDRVDAIIKEQGVDVYRQDMNTNPVPYWRYCEPENRRGVTQMKHVEGLYRFLDELLRRNPGLMIDNCSGGGKRIDIEMLKRSVPLHRSDYTVHFDANPVCGQSQGYGIMHWVPYSGMGSLLRDGDTYQFRSEMNASLLLSVRRAAGRDLSPEQMMVGVEPGVTWEWHREMMRQHAQVAHLFSGDFYPLCKCSCTVKKQATENNR